MKWKEEEVSEVLKEAPNDENNLFIDQSLKTYVVGLDISVGHNLSGRDALILSNLLNGRISQFVNFDEFILKLESIRYGKRVITIRRP